MKNNHKACRFVEDVGAPGELDRRGRSQTRREDRSRESSRASRSRSGSRRSQSRNTERSDDYDSDDGHIADLARIHVSLWFRHEHGGDDYSDGDLDRQLRVGDIEDKDKPPELHNSESTLNIVGGENREWYRTSYQGFLSFDPVQIASTFDEQQLLAGILKEMAVKINGDVKLQLKSNRQNYQGFITYLGDVQDSMTKLDELLVVLNPFEDTWRVKRDDFTYIYYKQAPAMSLDDTRTPNFKNMVLTCTEIGGTDYSMKEDEGPVEIQPRAIANSGSSRLLVGKVEDDFGRDVHLKRMADTPGLVFYVYVTTPPTQESAFMPPVAASVFKDALGRISTKIYQSIRQVIVSNLAANAKEPSLKRIQDINVLEWLAPSDDAIRVKDGDDKTTDRVQEATKRIRVYRSLGQNPEALEKLASNMQEDLDHEEQASGEREELFGDRYAVPKNPIAPHEFTNVEQSSPYKMDLDGMKLNHFGSVPKTDYHKIYYCADLLTHTMYPHQQFAPTTLQRIAPVLRFAPCHFDGRQDKSVEHEVFSMPIEYTYFVGLDAYKTAEDVGYPTPQYSIDGRLVGDHEKLEKVTPVVLRYGRIQRVWLLETVTYEWLKEALQPGRPFQQKLAREAASWLDAAGDGIGINSHLSIPKGTTFHVNAEFVGSFVCFEVYGKRDIIIFMNYMNVKAKSGKREDNATLISEIRQYILTGKTDERTDDRETYWNEILELKKSCLEFADSDSLIQIVVDQQQDGE